jgi:hypothetical protein
MVMSGGGRSETAVRSGKIGVVSVKETTRENTYR